MDSGQCRRCALLELVTQILCLLTWLEPESAQALTWYLCFTLFQCLDPDLPFFCICSPHCRRHLDEQIMALLRITIRATVRVVEADRTFSARPFFYFRLGNTLAVLQTSTRTMHSAGSQLPRRPCPAVRPTTTQGSTMTGVRATPAAALCETPGIAPQSAPLLSPCPTDRTGLDDTVILADWMQRSCDQEPISTVHVHPRATPHPFSHPVSVPQLSESPTAISLHFQIHPFSHPVSLPQLSESPAVISLHLQIPLIL